MGPVIEPGGTSGRAAACGLVLAHGSPSDPDLLDETLCRLARRVARRAPGWRIQAATLCKRGSVEAAVSAVGPEEPITVYPLFMSDGWFASEELPWRLEELTDGQVRYLAPLGLDPALPELCVRRALEGARKIGSEWTVSRRRNGRNCPKPHSSYDLMARQPCRCPAACRWFPAQPALELIP